jgi:peptidoglycan/xylan/chitin deacetylase (PgdA/CDA1 family)
LLGGLGAILMFHHVRPWRGNGFAPNRGLEITPEFLDEAIRALRANGFDIVALDDLKARLASPGARRFAVLTLDDGYRDNLEHALPVFERHGAPFAIYVATGFADATARLWWIEIEEAVRALDEVPFEGRVLPARDDAEKTAAFLDIYWNLRSGSEERLLAEAAALSARAGVDGAALTRSLCMGWSEIEGLSKHGLCSIGAHTVTHPRLAKLDDARARREMAESRATIEARLGKPVRHFAYPVGDPTSAGPRDFALAAEIGFDTAVTTRKGMLFSPHAGSALNLPRLSVNGDFQRRDYLDLLLTGAPFWIWNKGRRIAA